MDQDNVHNHQVEDPSEYPPETDSPATTWYLRPAFWIGFVGWFVVNGLLWVLVDSDADPYAAMSFGLMFMMLNFVILVVLGAISRTRQVALGVLTALAANFVVTLIQGVFYKGICFIPFFIDA